MIIVPAEQELDWRRPPIATLLLIVINCLIYFGYQLDDDQRYLDALDYYAESGLLEEEAKIYLQYVEETEGAEFRQAVIEYAEEYSLRAVGELITSDLAFTAYLRDTEHWGQKRETFTALQREQSYIAFGFVPAEPTIQGFIGSMFMHADFDHLLGNMLFLFVCGFALEVAFGRTWYLSLYLLSGCLSTGLSYFMDMESYIPQIGASGAVSGLMGMYVALYGMRQIQFFYWVVVFFGYFRAPALLIFPVWVGNEVYGYLYSDTNINYMAHMGGLLAGFIGVTVAKRTVMTIDDAYVEKELTPEEITSLKIEEMWNLSGKLKLDQAWTTGLALLKTEGKNQQLLQQLYNIARARPQSDKMHKLMSRIFSIKAPNPEFEHFRLMLVEDYLANTDIPQAMTRKNTLRLITPACKYQYVDLAFELSKLLMSVSRTVEVEGDRNKALLRVFMLQLKSSQKERVKDLLGFLREFAEGSEEVGMATESLQLASPVS